MVQLRARTMQFVLALTAPVGRFVRWTVYVGTDTAPPGVLGPRSVSRTHAPWAETAPGATSQIAGASLLTYRCRLRAPPAFDERPGPPHGRRMPTAAGGFRAGTADQLPWRHRAIVLQPRV